MPADITMLQSHTELLYGPHDMEINQKDQINNFCQ